MSQPEKPLVLRPHGRGGGDDPAATWPAIAKLVDSDNPPLRLMFRFRRSRTSRQEMFWVQLAAANVAEAPKKTPPNLTFRNKTAQAVTSLAHADPTHGIDLQAD